MQYLKDNKVQHRDLKASNCLLEYESGQFRVKLTDFGLSKSKTLVTTFSGRSSHGRASGTVTHMAPELLLNNSDELFCEESDVYSYSILMYEVITREAPFRGLNESQIIYQINQRKRPSPIPAESNSELIELMEHCWAHDVAMRPKFKQVLDDL